MALTALGLKNAKPKAKPYKIADEKAYIWSAHHRLKALAVRLSIRAKAQSPGLRQIGRPRRCVKGLSGGFLPNAWRAGFVDRQAKFFDLLRNSPRRRMMRSYQINWIRDIE
jgi:hypothetical protein